MSLRVIKMWPRVKASQRKLCLHPACCVVCVPPETALSALSTLHLTAPSPLHGRSRQDSTLQTKQE